MFNSCEKIIQDKEEPCYKKHQFRILVSIIIGYAMFYFVRQNFSMAIPLIQKKWNVQKQDIGIAISLFSIVYGIGKFYNGILSDRVSAKKIMIIGLLGSCFMNLIIPFGSFYMLVICWGMNGWFQSMGWPPIVKFLTRWFLPSELGAKWGIANISHQVGSVIVALGAGVLGNLEAIFLVPAVIAAIGSIIMFRNLKDKPEDVGLPPILSAYADKQESSFYIIRTVLIKNKKLIFLCMATFFLYAIRMGFFFWAPVFLLETKGSTFVQAGFNHAIFEAFGAFGGILAGYLGDKYSRSRIGSIYMLSLSVFLCIFWIIPMEYKFMHAVCMGMLGFLIYGPQVLTGVMATEIVPPFAVGAAVGLTGTFAYTAGSIFSGVGIGMLIDNFGWQGGYFLFVVSSLLGAFCFAMVSKK
jgi:sugar phosphate permease